MYSFKYSPRPNTLAIKRLPDDVTEAEKTRRILALQQRQREIQMRLFAAAVGTTEEVLVDGASRRRAWELTGRTSGNTVVNFPGPADWLGTLRRVRITEAAPNSLRGVPVDSIGAASLTNGSGQSLRPGRRRGTIMLIEMSIRGLMVDPATSMPIVVLRDADNNRVLPIWVGPGRGERDRDADREHRAAAADDARPAGAAR